jgi:hypothetical protein
MQPVVSLGTRYEWNTGPQYLRRGKYFLLRHKPSSALKNFEMAVKHCPVSRRRDLSEIFILPWSDFSEAWLQEWIDTKLGTAARIEKRGYSRQMLRRFINGYGMPKQICDEKMIGALSILYIFRATL